MASWDRELPVAIDAAILNVASFGDTDLFIEPVESRILSVSPAQARSQVLRLHRDLSAGRRTVGPEPLRALFPVGATGYRLGTQIDPIWNLYLLALVILAAPHIERLRMPRALDCVYSYRFVAPDSRGRIFDPDLGWRAFTERTATLATQHGHVVVCDIADFYPRVSVSMIQAALRSMEVPGGLIERLGKVLIRLDVDRYGLPVGGPASRLLAEALLAAVDQGLAQAGLLHCRFVDDIRLFARSAQEAHAHLARLSGLLAGYGLSLQKSKTRIVTGSELHKEISLAQDLQLVPSKGGPAGSVELRRRLLTLRPTDPYAGLRTQAASDLEAVAGEPGLAALLRREFTRPQVQPALARNLIASLRFMKPAEVTPAILFLLDPARVPAVLPVLNRLLHAVQVLAPELDAVAGCRIREALLKWLEPDGVLQHLTAAQAQVLRVLAQLPPDGSEATTALLVHCHDTSSDPLLRREILLLWGAWGSVDRLTRLARGTMPRTHWERRALLWALRQCELKQDRGQGLHQDAHHEEHRGAHQSMHQCTHQSTHQRAYPRAHQSAHQGAKLTAPRWAHTPSAALAPWVRWLRSSAARAVLKETRD